MASFEDFLSELPGFGAFVEPDAVGDLRKQIALAQQQTAERAAGTEQARMQGLQQTLGMAQPYNTALSNIFGSQYQIPFDQVYKNPMQGYNDEQAQQDRLVRARNATKIKPEI